MFPTQIHVCGEILDRKDRFDKGGRPMVNLMLQSEARTSKAVYTITATGKSIEDLVDVQPGDLVLINGRFEPAHGNSSYDMESWRYLNVFVEGCMILKKAHEKYEQASSFDDPYTEQVQDHPRFCNYGEDDVEYMARPERTRGW